jgi:Arc/MetJ-type ribon-helix-helix transcriptional regulator
MKSPIPVKRKKRGRPATGQDPVSAIRLSPRLAASIDKWAASNGAVSRSEAIRRLVELGLAESTPTKQTSRKAAAKASDMAAHQIDKLANPAMPEEERRARKRRLIKGPSEFREMRGDQPKPKG